MSVFCSFAVVKGSLLWADVRRDGIKRRGMKDALSDSLRDETSDALCFMNDLWIYDPLLPQSFSIWVTRTLLWADTAIMITLTRVTEAWNTCYGLRPKPHSRGLYTQTETQRRVDPLLLQ